jgi:hypothetical protein
MTIFTKTGMGERQAADSADRPGHKLDLLPATQTPAEALPPTAPADRREKPIQAAPQVLIDTICQGHVLSASYWNNFIILDKQY